MVLRLLCSLATVVQSAGVMNILVLNSGSSSQKACFYQIGDALPDHPPTSLWEGKVEWRPDGAYVEIKEFSRDSAEE